MTAFTNYKMCAFYIIMQMTTPYVVLIALKWFENNHMKANPCKFQAILFKCRKNEEVFYFNIGDELNKPVPLVKLLVVFIDGNLSFNDHVSKLSRTHG